MAEPAIRPSLKFIEAGFAVAVLLLIGAFVVHYMYLKPLGQPPWLPAVVSLFLLWPIFRYLRRQFTKLVISGDKLYYETGALSRQTRIIQIHKIQDVRVHQTLGQRMAGVGDLSIETAGEASRLTMASIDRPRAIAEHILELVNQEHGPASL